MYIIVFLLVIVFFWSGHVFLSLCANIAKVTSLKHRALKVFSKCICLCHCLFVGKVMFSHHFDQMSQRSQVSKIALWRCTLNVTSEITLYCCEMSYCQWCRPEQGTDIATYWAGSDCVWIKDWSGLAFASVTSWEKFWFGSSC